MNCKKCNTAVTSNYCCDCGLPVKIDRVDWHYIVHEIRHVLHFEKGILRTVKELLLKPGTSIHEFITVDRSRLVKPVIFIIITSLIYSTIEHLFLIEKGYIYYNDLNNSVLSIILNWLQSKYGYANILMSAFIAFWLKLIFKHEYNFFEVLILLFFVMGMGMLLYAVSAIFEGLTGIHAMVISSVVGVTYCSWAIGNFFDRRRVSSYFKAFFSYILGMITFFAFVVVLGLLIDFITH